MKVMVFSVAPILGTHLPILSDMQVIKMTTQLSVIAMISCVDIDMVGKNICENTPVNRIKIEAFHSTVFSQYNQMALVPQRVPNASRIQL